MVAKIDGLIDTLLADFANITSYKLGSKTVSKTEALEALTALRAQYAAEADETLIPYEDIAGIAYGYEDDGSERTEEIGDPWP
jgi:flagellar biosynthesis regulator FlbT